AVVTGAAGIRRILRNERSLRALRHLSAPDLPRRWAGVWAGRSVEDRRVEPARFDGRAVVAAVGATAGRDVIARATVVGHRRGEFLPAARRDSDGRESRADRGEGPKPRRKRSHPGPRITPQRREARLLRIVSNAMLFSDHGATSKARSRGRR